MSNIYVYQHTGLGDFISCNGLIRSLLKKIGRDESLYLFTPSQYKEMISFMYRDEPKIKFITISFDKKMINSKKKGKHGITKEEQSKISRKVEEYIQSLPDKNFEYIRIGYDFYWPTSHLNPNKNIPWTCDMIFYKQMNIPYKLRYSNCYWQRDKIAEERVFNELIKDKSKPFAFVHDEPGRNFVINEKNISYNLPIIRNNPKENIFNLGLVIERASEIHVMESSIRNMLETLNTSKAKHYFYRFSHVPWGTLPYYNKEKKILIGTSKNWIFRDLEEIDTKKNWLKRIFNF